MVIRKISISIAIAIGLGWFIIATQIITPRFSGAEAATVVRYLI